MKKSFWGLETIKKMSGVVESVGQTLFFMYHDTKKKTFEKEKKRRKKNNAIAKHPRAFKPKKIEKS